MSRYVAFLRGMNLGKRRITNEELVACFEALGLREASAFLASGNVIFDSDEERTTAQWQSHLAEHLEQSLGYAVPTAIRSADAIRTLAAVEPFTEAELAPTEGRVQVALLVSPPDGDVTEALAALSSDVDQLRMIEGELFWLPNRGVSKSPLKWRDVEAVVNTTTVRTHRTVQRIAKKFL